MFYVFDGDYETRRVQDYSGASHVQTREELLDTIAKCRAQRLETKRLTEACRKIQRWYRQIRARDTTRNLASRRAAELLACSGDDPSSLCRLAYFTKLSISSQTDPKFLVSTIQRLIGAVETNFSSMREVEAGLLALFAHSAVEIAYRVSSMTQMPHFYTVRLLETLWSKNTFSHPAFLTTLRKIQTSRDYFDCVRRVTENMISVDTQSAGDQAVLKTLCKIVLGPLVYTADNDETSRSQAMHMFIVCLMEYSSQNPAILRLVDRIFTFGEFPFLTFYQQMSDKSSNQILTSVLILPLIRRLDGTICHSLSDLDFPTCGRAISLISSSLLSKTNRNLDMAEIRRICWVLKSLVSHYYLCRRNFDDSTTREYYLPVSQVVRAMCAAVWWIDKRSSEIMSNEVSLSAANIVELGQDFLVDCWGLIRRTVNIRFRTSQLSLHRLREIVNQTLPVLSVFTCVLLERLSQAESLPSGELLQIREILLEAVPLFVHIYVFFLKLIFSSSPSRSDRLLHPTKRPAITNKDRRKFLEVFECTVSMLNSLRNLQFVNNTVNGNLWQSNEVKIDHSKPIGSLIYYLEDSMFDELMESVQENRLNFDSTYENLQILVTLKKVPFIFPFSVRKTIAKLSSRRENASPLDDDDPSHPSEKIRRNFMYEDAYNAFYQLPGSRYHRDVRVNMVNEVGAREAGVDQGGLFKEFIVKLIDAGFDEKRGLFKANDQGHMYPNPASRVLVPNFRSHYRFLGCMLGKLIFDGLVCTVHLADFFLLQILPNRPRQLDFHYMKSYDRDIHRSLRNVRCAADASKLGLDFTVANDLNGTVEVQELKENGSKIAVTNENVDEYITLSAQYRMTTQIKEQIEAFRQGFLGVLGNLTLSIFCLEEVHTLISGADGHISVEDWRRHTNYAGIDNHNGHVADWFWSIVSSFTDMQRSQLMMFTTGLPRPPISGFEDLSPPFTLHCLQMRSINSLPSASTCTNTLYIPLYPSEQVLREKLIYSIESKSGFEET